MYTGVLKNPGLVGLAGLGLGLPVWDIWVGEPTNRLSTSQIQLRICELLAQVRGREVVAVSRKSQCSREVAP